MRIGLGSKGFEEANGGWRPAGGGDGRGVDDLARERAAAGYTSFSEQPRHFALRARACHCLARGLVAQPLASCVQEGWGGDPAESRETGLDA